MSTASAPKTDDGPDAGADAEGWALLEGLRRRLDDHSALGRKTQAQVTQLAESVAALVAQQRRRSVWLNLNSFVAYVVFTVLCGAGCFLLYLSRAQELGAARDLAIGERDAAVRRADEATVRAVARESAETKAWEVYQLLEAGKRSDAVAKLETLREQPLSKTERAVLAARVHETRAMEVDAALRAAVASIKAGRHAEAVKPLEAALVGEPPGPRQASIHYHLGVAHAKTDLAKATAHLKEALAGGVPHDDARFQLASVLDRSGAYAVARVEYEQFAKAHPQSPLALFAWRRSATLARFPAVGAPLRPPGALGPGVVRAPAGARPVPATPAEPPATPAAPPAAAPSEPAPNGP